MRINYTFQVKAKYIQSSFEYDCLVNDNCLKIYKNHNLCALVFGDNLDESYFKNSKLNSMKKQELIELYDNLELGYHVDDMTKQELVDELLSVSVEHYYQNHVDNNNWHDIESDYISRGYSQGDAIHIIFNNKEWDTEGYREYIDNCLWDSPIDARLEVIAETQDGFIKTIAEIDYHECQENSFKYDADEFFNYVLRNSTDEPWHNALKENKQSFNVEVKY